MEPDTTLFIKDELDQFKKLINESKLKFICKTEKDNINFLLKTERDNIIIYNNKIYLKVREFKNEKETFDISLSTEKQIDLYGYDSKFYYYTEKTGKKWICEKICDNCSQIELDFILCGKNPIYYYLRSSILMKKKPVDYVMIYQDDTFLGILVAMSDECNLFNEKNNGPDVKNIWSVRIVCSNPDVKGLGTKLMGIYLYSLLKRKEAKPDYPQYIQTILEVADGYHNLGALCLYEKFGFKINPELYCNEYIKKVNEKNLKMILKLDEINIDKIIEIVKNESVHVYEKSDYCKKEKEIDVTNLQREYINKIRQMKYKKRKPSSKNALNTLVFKYCINCKKRFASSSSSDFVHCNNCNTKIEVECDTCNTWVEIDTETFEKLNDEDKWICDNCIQINPIDSGIKKRSLKKRSLKKGKYFNL